MTTSESYPPDDPVQAPLYWVFVVGCMLLWLVHAAGSVFDAYNGTGGNGQFWIKINDSGEVVVDELRPGLADVTPLRPGDVIVSVDGSTDLPRNQYGWRFRTSVITGAFEVRRAGQAVSLTVPRANFEYRPLFAAKDVLLGVLALVLVVYAPRTRLVMWLIGLLFLCGSLGQGAAVGWSAEIAGLLIAINIISQMLFWPVALIALLLALKRDATKALLAPCWLTSLLGVFLAMIYVGEPLSQPVARGLYFGAIFGFMAICAGLVLWLYPKTTGLVRLQLNWPVFAWSLGALLMVVAYRVGVYLDDADMVAYFVAGELLMVLVALGILAAVLFHDLIPVNRATVASVSYAVIAIVFALLFEFVLEPLVALLSERFAVDADISQTLLIVAVTLAAPRIKQKVEPVLNRVFAAERGST